MLLPDCGQEGARALLRRAVNSVSVSVSEWCNKGCETTLVVAGVGPYIMVYRFGGCLIYIFNNKAGGGSRLVCLDYYAGNDGSSVGGVTAAKLS